MIDYDGPKFCNKCGAKLQANANFCGECGNPITRTPDSTPQSVEQSVVFHERPPESQGASIINKSMRVGLRTGFGCGKLILIAFLVVIIGIVAMCGVCGYAINEGTNPDSGVYSNETSSPLNNTKVSYSGCDGLKEVIDLVPTDGLGKMQLWSIVNIGDDYSCTKTIQGLGFGDSSDPVPTSTPFNNTTVTYKGCDGLNEVIDLVPTDGLAKMQLWDVVNMGDDASCDIAIETLGYK